MKSIRFDEFYLLMGIAWLAAVGCGAAPEPQPARVPAEPVKQEVVFALDLKELPIGKTPADTMIMQGSFVTHVEKNERLLRLAGSEPDECGILLGPVRSTDTNITAEIRGSKRSRLKPRFGIGLNGMDGFRLRVSPAHKRVELLYDGIIRTTAAFAWVSDEWTRLELRIQKKQKGWQVQGSVQLLKAPDGPVEKTQLQWMLDQDPPPGRASLWGTPYSRKPLDFRKVVVIQ